MAQLEPVGVIGGSGVYSLLDEPEQRAVDTPYGPPSDALTVGSLAGREVVFLPRHGARHQWAPHVLPYRANLWALRAAGARQVVSLSAVGSLRVELGVGALVVPDQIADRTHGRSQTYFDAGDGVGHATFADPYCPRGRAAALGGNAAAPSGGKAAVPHDGGVLVVVNGPRFSSRAESLEFQSHGWSIIGMTAMPEAGLARELGLCYTTLALVTDLDAGVDAGAGVTHGDVLAQFAANLPRLRELLTATLQRLPDAQGDCACGNTAAHPNSFVLP